MIKYITSSLFYKNNRLFNSKGPVTKKNYWVENDYGWEQIDPTFKMNKHMGILDCGGEGDCLFKCIAEAINNHRLINFIDTLLLRKKISNSIDENLFEEYLENYKIQKSIGELNGFWNPNDIKSFKDLQLQIQSSSFWGDYLCLEVLSQKLKLNFIVFNENFNIIFKQTKFNRNLLLLCIDSFHFQLISYFNGRKIQTLISSNIFIKITNKK